MTKHKDLVAVITGAASGIGKALAQELAKQGADLALADKNMTGLLEVKNLVEQYGINCSICELDVSDRGAVNEFAEQVISEHKKVDMVFNNAGVTLIDSVENQSLEDFKWLMDINFWGVVHGTNAFLPYLKKSPNAHLINVSSLFGLLSLPLQSAYNASKHAVKGFTEALKMEMAGTNVNVHCVHPGGIKTKITENAKISTKNVSRNQILHDFNKAAKTTAGQAAIQILKELKINQRRILIGNDAKWLDRIARWFPKNYEKILGFEKGVLAKRKELQNEEKNIVG